MKIDTLVNAVVFSLYILTIYPKNVECVDRNVSEKTDFLDSPQRKNVYIETKLREEIQNILSSYRKPKDLKLKSTFTLSITPPAGVEEEYITDVVNKTLENIVSNTFEVSRTGSTLSIVNFSLKTENQKDSNGAVRKQNINVKFDVPNIDSKGECAMDKSYKNDTWCSDMIKWSFEKHTQKRRLTNNDLIPNFSFNFNDPHWANLRNWMKSRQSHEDDTRLIEWSIDNENKNERRMKRYADNERTFKFDFYRDNFYDLQNWMRKQLLIQGKYATFTIDLTLKKFLRYGEWYLVIMDINECIRHVEKKGYIKYLADPHLDSDVKTMKLLLRVTPPNEIFNKAVDALKYKLTTVVIPQLKKMKHLAINFHLQSIFNAVDLTRQKMNENTLIVIFRLLRLDRIVEFSCSELNYILKHAGIDFGEGVKCACDRIFTLNSDKYYMVIKFTLTDCDSSCQNNFGPVEPPTSIPTTTEATYQNENCFETTTTTTEAAFQDENFHETTTRKAQTTATKATSPYKNCHKSTTLKTTTTATSQDENSYKTTTPKTQTTATSQDENSYKTTTPKTQTTATKPTSTEKNFNTITTEAWTPDIAGPSGNTFGCTDDKSYIFIKIITEEMIPVLFERFPHSELIFKKERSRPKYCQINKYWSIEMKFDSRKSSALADIPTLKAILDDVFKVYQHMCTIEYDLSQAIISRKSVKILICFQNVPGTDCQDNIAFRDGNIRQILTEPLPPAEKSTLSIPISTDLLTCTNTMKINDSLGSANTSRGRQLIQHIVDTKILHIFCVLYPSTRTETKITEIKKSNLQGACDLETFDIAIDVVGRVHFRYETVKYVELLFIQLQKTYTNVTAACFLNGGINKNSNIQMTMRMKVAEEYENCLIPKVGRAKICSPDEEETPSSVLTPAVPTTYFASEGATSPNTVTLGFRRIKRNIIERRLNDKSKFVDIITQEMIPLLFERFPNSELTFTKEMRHPKNCGINKYWSILLKFDYRRNRQPPDTTTLKAMLDDVFKIYKNISRVEYEFDLSKAIINRRSVKILICFQNVPRTENKNPEHLRDEDEDNTLDNRDVTAPLDWTTVHEITTPEKNDPNALLHISSPPASVLVDQIVKDEMLPIFKEYYPEFETRTKITRVDAERKTIGPCNIETFDISFEVLGGMFVVEIKKSVEIAVMRLPKINTDIIVACVIDSGERSRRNMLITIRMKVKLNNEKCAFLKMPESILICSPIEQNETPIATTTEGQPTVIPGGLPPAYAGISIPKGGLPYRHAASLPLKKG